MKDFRELKVWQEGHLLALAVHRVTARFPRDGQFGLTSQMRRAATSIPTNIVEGCGRAGDAELARFSQVAMGSASEVEYQLLLAHALGFLSDSDHGQLSRDVTEVKRMLATFIKRLKASGAES